MIGITGGTGQIGGRVAQMLAAAGAPQRLLVRDRSRAPALPGAEVVPAGSYADGEAARRALEGVDVLLMVSAHEAADRLAQHFTFVDAAAAAGVRHVVYTSFVGASPTATFTLARDHWATEEHLRASGMACTCLRNNLYMDVLPHLVDEGVIRGPAGEGRVSAVARADIARVAVEVLCHPGRHGGRTYELTGPASSSLGDVARALTASSGQRVCYEDETIERAYASRSKYGAPDWQLEAWVSTYLAIRNGEMERITGDVQRITGRVPVSLQEFLTGAP